MSDNLTPVRTPEIVAVEIRGYTATALSAIIEIGKRFKEIKGMLPHGEFLPYLEKHTGYKHSSVNNFMRLAEEYGDKALPDGLSYSKALVLLTLPSGEREEFVEQNNVADMSKAELQAALRERDEARRVADEAKAELDAANENARSKESYLALANARIKELESRPVDVAVREPTQDELDARAREIAGKEIAEAEKAAEQKLAELEDKLAKAEETAKKAKDKLKTASAAAEQKGAAEIAAAKKDADDARAELERLRAELDAAKSAAAKAKIAGDGDLALVQSYAEELISYANKLNGIRKKAQANGNDELAGKVGALLQNVAAQIGGLV